MAILITENAFSSDSISAGERKSLRTLQNGLDDSALLWYEPQLAYMRRPDIIAYIPTLGLLLYEVKDWSISNILEANPDTWKVKHGSSIKKTQSPYKQARKYYFNLNKMLEKRDSLIAKEGNHEGKFKIPIAVGVIFPNIRKEDFIQKSLNEVLEIDKCLFKDDIELIQQEEEPRKTRVTLKKHFNPWWPHDELSEDEVAELRGALHPEITSLQKDKGGTKKDIILDTYQERVARKIGAGHRTVRGVAGSGKSLVLCSKALIIAQENPDWKVLITCYNVALASQLKYYINSFRKRESVSLNNIEITNFHQLCSKLGRKYKVPPPIINEKSILSSASFSQLSEDQQEAKLEEERSSSWGNHLQTIGRTSETDKYNAILVDESQDFHPSWLKGLTLLLDGETNFLLLAEDPNQKIYPRSFSYKDAGIQLAGRKNYDLPICYRSTREIVVSASKLVTKSKPDAFYKKYLEEEGSLEAREDEMRQGTPPTLDIVENYSDTCQRIASDISDKLENGYKCSDLGIIYLHQRTPKKQNSPGDLYGDSINYVDELRAELSAREIPHFWMTESRETKRNYDQFNDQVTITTIFSAKGLEFEAAYIVGLELYPWEKRNKRENASMLYVAMTRAKSELQMFSTQRTSYVEEIEEAIRSDD
ncbi:MAG: ATP-binding domain-containing protein [Candidatus Dadabacteria bacterium]|nr:ATP-binding domain-containing protein [Candidatus Dadabacteria bacterium]